jgi:hypothetical protein
MPRDIRFRLLTEDTAGEVGAVTQKVYAGSYPLLALPDAREAWRAHQERDTVAALAFDGQEAVGLLTLKRWPDNRRVYELGMLSVIPGYRTGRAAAGLLSFAKETFASLVEWDAVFMENVSTHCYSQFKAVKNGAVDCALALSAMPALTGGGRLGFIMSFLENPSSGAPPIYLPDRYAAVLPLFYQGLRPRRLFAAAEARPAGVSAFRRRVFPTLSLLKETCLYIGADFPASASSLADVCRRGGVETIQIYLPLTSPFAGWAAAHLAGEGFFLGGVCPFFLGGDALLLQKCREKDLSSWRVYSAKGRLLADAVRQDAES